MGDWRDLAHRSRADLEASGLRLRIDTVARKIDVEKRQVLVADQTGVEESVGYEQLIVGTGALPLRPPIDGLSALGPDDGVHLLHSMKDTFALMGSIEELSPTTAVVVGAGYIGLEMADALTLRGISVTQIEQLPEVLPTVDSELGALVRAVLINRGVEVITGAAVSRISRTGSRFASRGPDR